MFKFFMKIHYDFLELFESGATEGKSILEITGEDVAAFCDELLRSVQTYTADWREEFNRHIQKKNWKEIRFGIIEIKSYSAVDE